MAGVFLGLDMSNLSTQDKWHVLQLTLIFNSVVSVALFLSSLAISDLWGSSAAFQLSSTAFLYMIYCFYLFSRVRVQQVLYADFIGGISVVINILLLQTAILWHGFANGLGFSEMQKEGEEIFSRENFPSGKAESIASSFAWICFLGNVFVTFLTAKWKDDLIETNTGLNFANFASKGVVQSESHIISQPSKSNFKNGTFTGSSSANQGNYSNTRDVMQKVANSQLKFDKQKENLMMSSDEEDEVPVESYRAKTSGINIL